jgi:hypothetical protein
MGMNKYTFNCITSLLVIKIASQGDTMTRIFSAVLYFLISVPSFASNADRIELVKACQSHINFNSLEGDALFEECVSDGRSPEVVNACARGAKILTEWDTVPFFVRCLDSDASANLIEACVDLAEKERAVNRPYFMLICLGE